MLSYMLINVHTLDFLSFLDHVHEDTHEQSFPSIDYGMNHGTGSSHRDMDYGDDFHDTTLTA